MRTDRPLTTIETPSTARVFGGTSRGVPLSQPPTSQFAVQPCGDGDVVLLATGEIDLVAKEAFDESLRLALEATDRRLIVDLSGVEFMDSTALNSLVRAQSTMNDGARITLRGAKPSAKRVFEIAGLMNYFTVE